MPIKLSHVFVGAFMVVLLGGCAGGSRGTGIRPDRKLSDDHGHIDDEVMNAPKLPGWLRLFGERCSVERSDFTASINISTELGGATVLEKPIGSDCLVTISNQAEQVVFDLSKLFEHRKFLPYKILKVGCNVNGEEIQAGRIQAENAVVRLQRLPWRDADHFELLIDLGKAEQPAAKLLIFSEQHELCLKKEK